MQYVVLRSGQELVIDNVQYYFAQQYSEKLLTEFSANTSLCGALYPTGNNELKISYNLTDGMVTLEGKHSPSVKLYYNSSAFYDYISPVSEAIRWLSKLCLLNHIYQQQDTKVNALINKSNLYDTSARKLSYEAKEPHLDRLLISILNLIAPPSPTVQRMIGFFYTPHLNSDVRTNIQTAMHLGFLDLDINKKNVVDKISSINHVSEWLNAVGAHLAKEHRLDSSQIKP